MKRLLCILSNMNAGGAETFLMKIYRGVDFAQYQFDYCVNVIEKNFYEDEIISYGGKLYRIPSRSDGVMKHNRALYKLIKNNEYQYVLVVSATSFSYFDLTIAKLAGAKVCSIRSTNSSTDSSKFKSLVQGFFRIVFNKNADWLIAPSDLAAINLFGKRCFRDPRFVYIRNGLDVDEYKYSITKRNDVREELKLSNDDFVIGHVGRFYAQKNHDFLLDIFAEILKENRSAKLLMVGSGELQKTIEEKAKRQGIIENVIICGTRSDVNCVLSAMDFFVFPSFYEGMPNSVIEAETSGLQCLISDSITREANITGTVYYMHLNNKPIEWAKKVIALSQQCNDRENAYVAMKDAGYDISKTREDFVNTVFRKQ